MMRIDTRKWKSFPIGGTNGLFNVVKGKRLTKAAMREGHINYIGASALNNGITAKIANDACLHPANTITVSYNGSVGESFYQSEPFWASDDVNVLYPNFVMSPAIAIFFLPLLKAISKKYGFNNKWKKEQMETSQILLPEKDGAPDFAYMANYIDALQARVRQSVDILAEISTGGGVIANYWQPFHLYDDNLFEIDSGTKLDRVKMTTYNPSVNFVGRANANNGVTDFIDEISDLKPYDAGLMTISLGGEYLGSCFVQDKPFYTSQNVDVLIPKRPMTDACKQFIAAIVFREGQTHYKAFSDELNRHIKRDFTILLPARDDGTPNFDYMDAFMRAKEREVSAFLDCIRQVA